MCVSGLSWDVPTPTLWLGLPRSLSWHRSETQSPSPCNPQHVLERLPLLEAGHLLGDGGLHTDGGPFGLTLTSCLVPGLEPAWPQRGRPRGPFGPSCADRQAAPSTRLSTPESWSLFLFLCAGPRGVEGSVAGAEGLARTPFPRRHPAACLSLAYFPSSGFPVLSKQLGVAWSAWSVLHVPGT